MKKKKKVLIVSHRWPPRYGGLQNIAFKYAEALSKSFNVTVFTSKEKNYANTIPKDCNLVEGYASPFLYEKFGLPQPLFSFSAIKKLKKEIELSNTIIINDRYYISSFLSVFFGKLYKKKIITIIHTPVLKYENPIANVFYKINNFLSKYVLENSTILFAVSKQTAEVIKEYFHLNKEIRVLYNPLNLNEFKKKQKKFDKFTVLFVGRFVQKKGVELIPEIAKKLDPTIFNLIIIGDGPLLNKVKKESTNLKNITFTGTINNRKKICWYYQKSQLFLITSKYGEAFPLVIGDALAAGLPCVSTPGGTYLEIFDYNVGELCSWNAIEIAKKINFLKNTKSVYKLKSKNAKAFAKNNLDMKITIKTLEKVISNEQS